MFGDRSFVSKGLSPAIRSEVFYFLTPYPMPNDKAKGIVISFETAQLVVRALYCYQRVIGLGGDLRAASVNRELYSDITSAIRVVLNLRDQSEKLPPQEDTQL